MCTEDVHRPVEGVCQVEMNWVQFKSIYGESSARDTYLLGDIDSATEWYSFNPRKKIVVFFYMVCFLGDLGGTTASPVNWPILLDN